MARSIVLVRHGATAWSDSGRHTGRTDIPLTQAGERQATALRARLATFSFEGVLSSPLQRTRRTAELAGFGAVVESTDLLLEMDYGDDEGRTRDQIRSERPGWDIFTDGPLRGETVVQVAARATALLAELAPMRADVLLFSHGHMLRILAPTYLGQTPDFGRHLDLGPASISVLASSNGYPTIARWNEPHG
jgi:broad specificity phosphatase PhoE